MGARRPTKEEAPKPNRGAGGQQQFSPSPDQRRRYNAYVKQQFAGSENPDVMDIRDWTKLNK